MMIKTVKRLAVERGTLFAVADGRRLLLAECEAEVKLYTSSVSVPILGRGSVITGRGAALMLTVRHHLNCSADERFFGSISRFEFQGDIVQTDGTLEHVIFDRCQLDGDLDLTEAGTCQFDLLCPPETLRRLAAM